MEAYNEYSRERLEFVSFLESSNLDKARNMIASKKMAWPQVILTREMKDRFKIMGFPTNVLIWPDGVRNVTVGQIHKGYFASYLK